MFCPPLRWCFVLRALSVPCFCSRPPAFAPGSSEVAVGLFWSFCILLSIICPSCTCTKLFLVPYSFFVFCCLRRRLSRCKHCSKVSRVPGPRSQPVSISKGHQSDKQVYSAQSLISHLGSNWFQPVLLCSTQRGFQQVVSSSAVL